MKNTKKEIDIVVRSGISGLRDIVERFPGDLLLSDACAIIVSALPVSTRDHVYLARSCGRPLTNDLSVPLISLAGEGNHPLGLRLSGRLCGGKGGFGSQLRAQGGRMAARRKRGGRADETANDRYRNLDGRRLKSIRQAKDLAVYLETAPQRLKEATKLKRDRLQAIISSEPSTVRYDDTKYLEESEDLIIELKKIVGESFAFNQDDEDSSIQSNSEEDKIESSEPVSRSDDAHFEESGGDEFKQHIVSEDTMVKEQVRNSFESGSSSSSRMPKVASFFADEELDEDDEN
ncbi:telomere stability and silencing-domain-containing protein [Lipomyces oligophaga]|uniref:telomere stability and silencing-domain-containing protein n=1 Tax=Lipomyces oligophaga TaxID=45792 RepID=UPI0034CE8D29